MKIGFLFPGQGSQFKGMGKDLYEKYQEIRDTYNKVQEITGVNVKKISFEGSSDELNQTKNTQICILTMSLAILNLLEKEKINAEMSAGLSLGEYSALIYSKAITFEDGVKLVKNRGEYMQNLVPIGDWSMLAILGMTEDEVIEVCNKTTKGFATAVNFNCPGQIVVSGDKEGISQVEEIAKEMGAKKVRKLNTYGPFHTEKLVEASNALRKDLENLKINKFETEVVRNIDGKKYSEKDDVKSILAKHIISPVRFSDCLKTMLENGVDTFIEIGPGKTLSGFVKRMPREKEIKVLNINSVESFENTVKILKDN